MAEPVKATSIRYRRLDDLVKFVSMTPAPFLNHAQRDGKHVYFTVLPFSGGILLYYYEAEKRIEGEYVTFNRMSGEVHPSSKPSFDAQALDLPVLDVESTDLLEGL